MFGIFSVPSTVDSDGEVQVLYKYKTGIVSSLEVLVWHGGIGREQQHEKASEYFFFVAFLKVTVIHLCDYLRFLSSTSLSSISSRTTSCFTFHNVSGTKTGIH